MLNVTKKDFVLKTQTLAVYKNTVESGLNLSAENLDKIISVGGFVAEPSCRVENGFLYLTGKVYFNVVFMGEELERLESGVKFDYKRAVDGTPQSARAAFSLTDVAVKEDGGMLYITAELIEEVTFSYAAPQKIVTGGNLLTKCADFDYDKVVSCHATFNGEEEFERAKIKKVLHTGVSACVTNVVSGNDQLVVEGQAYVSLYLLPISENGDIIKERLVVPFSYEIECVGAKEGDTCYAKCATKGQTVKVLNVEESQNSQISVAFSLDIFACAVRKVKQSFVVDAMSCECEVDKVPSTFTVESFVSQRRYTERVLGRAICDVPEYSRLVTAMQDSVIVTQTDFSGAEVIIGGIIYVDCVFQGDSGLVSRRAQMPFEIKLDKTAQTVSDVLVIIDNLTAKLKSGRIELDISLKVCFNESTQSSVTVIEDLIEGAEKSVYKSIISVYMAKKGDTAWDVMRAMGEAEDVILEQNPHLCFPLSGTERITVFRKN